MTVGMIEDIYKLSPIQHGILVHSLAEPASGLYFEQFSWPFDSALDLAAFGQAWRLVQARHPILRTAFFWAELDEPLQVVRRGVPLRLRLLDLRALTPQQRERLWPVLLTADRRTGFDLSAPPLMRVTLIQRAEGGYQCLWSYHHLLLDGWSVGLLMNDVFTAYDALCRGQTPALPPRRPYRDYITWLRQQDLAAAEGFWRQQLADVTEPTRLRIAWPGRYDVPAAEPYAERERVLSESLSSGLQALARRQRVTLTVVLQAAWALLLRSYSGSGTVVFGLTVGGRPPGLPGSEAMIGLFINTLPVRVQVSPAQPLADWMADLHAQQMALRRYEYSPLVAVQGWSGVPRGVSLFESILVVENFRLNMRTRELQVSQRTNYPLAVVVEPGAQARVRIGYETARFAEATVEQMLGHLVTLLAGMVAQPEERVGAIVLLTPAEQAALVQRWRGSPAGTPTVTIHELVAAQAERAPDAIAMVFSPNDQRPTTNDECGTGGACPAPTQHLTYRELNAHANRLARHLRALGVGPETCVGVCLERGLELVIGLLGVLKAGGAYVPLDPAYPTERIAFMLEDSQARVLIRTNDQRPTTNDDIQSADCRPPADKTDHLITLSPCHLVNLEADAPVIARQPATNPAPLATAEHLAYVIYTSGSTGAPKGVLVTHANLARLFSATRDWFHFDERDAWTMFHSAAFDFSVWELWGALCHGGRLVVVPHWLSRSPDAFYQLLRAQRVTILNQTPSAFRQLVRAAEQAGSRADAALRLVIFGGEALDFAILAPWFARHGDQRPQLVNMYGITETTVHVTYRPIAAADLANGGGSVIGQPIPDLQSYLLDDQLRPVPIGIAGELYVGGAGVARGYLGRPDLTAERFVPNPFAEVSGIGYRVSEDSAPSTRYLTPDTRLYKTGDLACFLPSGEFVYLGRIDQQVKVRGYRIELGEVAAALRQHTLVREAVVVLKDERLVAYIVPAETTMDDGRWTMDDKSNAEPSSIVYRLSSFASELRAFLKHRLPAYMLPSGFVLLDALPLTPNGKLDRKALPAPDPDSLARADFAAPRTPHEELLASIFASVLGLREVGIHDHFFALGGHSLLATQVISRVRRTFAVELPLRSLFEHPTAAELAERIAAFQREGRGAPPSILPVQRDGALPLSFAQQRLWFLTQLEPNSSAYNIPIAVRMHGALDVGRLRWSLEQIVRRHEALRTTFVAVDGEPSQRIAPPAWLALPLLDLRGLPEAEREVAARHIAHLANDEPFDLARGPLIRAALLRLAADEHLLALTMHHIVSDGWSMGVLARELAALYAAYGAEPREALPDLPIQYADYAAWQRSWLQGDVLAEQVAYWRRSIAGLAPLELPADHRRPQVASFPAAYRRFSLSKSVCDDLLALSRHEGSTLFMVLLAAFQLLLARYSDQGDIAVGTPIAGRTHSETEGLIGFFVNTLVLRSSLAGDPTVRAALERVRETCLGAYAHQDLPFEQVVEALAPARDLSRHPLFQVMFMLQNAPLAPLALPGLSLQPLMLPNIATKFDLSLSLIEDAGELVGTLEYRADLFDTSTIMRLARHFQALLTAMAAQPDLRVSDLPLLSAAERAQLLIEWNDTAAGDREQGTGDRTIQGLFEAQAARTPDAVAIVFEPNDEGRRTNGAEPSSIVYRPSSTVHMTYGELNARANRLAHHLRALGVEPECTVGLFVERSPAMVVGLLGVLKAGGAYLPLDPSYPAERLDYMLRDSRARVLVTATNDQRPTTNDQRLTTNDKGRTTNDQIDHLVTLSPCHLVDLGADWSQIARSPNMPPQSGATPDSLAYVIYTSGSTGMPKGVLGSHRGAINRFRWMWATLPFTPGEVGCQKTALSFVDSIWELFGPLLQGVRVVLIPDETLKDAGQLVRALAAHEVTRIVLVPSLLRLLLESSPDLSERLPALRLWVSSGETLPIELCRRFREGMPRSVLLNLYGSSEVAADATWFDTRASGGEASVAIGRPIANTRIYLLDRRGHPAPIGVPAELYVGGAGLARGYLNRPNLTAAAFVPNPFAEVSGIGYRVLGAEPSDTRYPIPDTRLYRMGDLARYRADGTIEYLGRRDRQIKLRGYRVELGEVEAALRAHPDVQSCAVVVWPVTPAGPRLVAYVITEQEGQLSSAEMRAFLQARLPEYLVPALFVPLHALPLTPSGKLDRRALPDPADLLLTPGELLAAASPTYVAPRTPTEERIAAIWAEVLDRSQVGVEDNFFELGGHSLLAMRVIARVGKAFGIDLLVRRLFETPTVAGLARLVDSALRTAPGRQPPLRAIPRDGPLPLSFAQQRLWFLDQLDPDSAAYHMPIAVRLEGQLDATILRSGLAALIRRHETLRTTFVAVDGQPAQVVHPAARLALCSLDLRALPEAVRAETVRRLIGAEIHSPFDLARGPLIRGALLRLAADEHILLLVVHHIVSDGWSQGILLRELAVLCAALASGSPAELPALPIQYADYAAWQRAWVQGEVLETQLSYWKRQLAGLAPLELPLDRPRPALQTFRGARQRVEFPASLVAPLRELSQDAGATVFITLLMALQLLLARYSGRDDVSVGTPIAGRNHVEVEGVVGFFASTLVMRTDLSGALTVRELLGRVRETALGAYSHQDVPFEQLVDALQPARDLSYNPLFQVLFGLQSVPQPSFTLTGLALRPLDFDLHVARFDLSLDLWEGPQSLGGWFEYNTDLFDATTITRMAGHLRTLLEAIIADPQRRADALPILTRPERQQLLVDWNEPGNRGQGTGDSLSLSDAWCLHELFQQQAVYTPDAVAVVFDDEGRETRDEGRGTKDKGRTTNGAAPSTIDYRPSSVVHLTYGELNARANRLAHYLRALGVGPDVCVGIYMERSVELIAALLAVLKAGGAYLPLDPAYPSERITFMLEDSGAAVVIVASNASFDKVTRRQGDKVTDVAFDVTLSTSHLVNLGAEWPSVARMPSTDLNVAVELDNLAYVIYTSGSTGRPKGVQVGHRGVVNIMAAARPGLRFGAPDVWTIVHSYGFDFSVWELWGPLLCGGRLVVVPLWMTQEPAALRDLLARQRVTVLNQTPSALRLLLDARAAAGSAGALSLRLIVCGGEAFAPDLIEPALACGAPVWNFYGPTEATVWAATKLLRPGERLPDALAIGRPLTNTALYVLDQHLRPAPIGVAGELYIGGAQLARGYLNRPDLTAARFIPNPFAEVSGAGYRVLGAESSDTRYPTPDTRLYKTGDLARYLPSGNLEFLGRIDQQIKIRGYRIELGEIEAVLAAHPAVREAVVVAREDRPGDKRLVAYVVQGTGDRGQGTGIPGFLNGDEGRMTNDERRTTGEDRGLKIEDSDADVSESLSSILYPLSSNLRKFLAARLPAYMVPATFVLLDALPLSANGKVDRRGLPPPDDDSVAAEPGAAPQTPIEEVVAGIWANVLGLAQVGLHDNFFALGGHSLLAVQVLARIQAALGVALPVRSLFDTPTVAALAASVAATQPATALPPIHAAPRDGDLPLSFAQQRLWFLDQLAPGSPAYNLPAALRLRGPLALAALAQSFAALGLRHETLRTTFVLRSGQPAQRIAALPALKLPLLDLRALPPAARAIAVQQLSTAEAWRPFDLARGPLLRVALLRVEAQEHILLLTLHHIVADGWSMGVLVREVTGLYAAAQSGEQATLPPLPIQYADYALWQRQWLAGPAREIQLAYWRRLLADLPVLDLPTDRPRPAVATVAGARQPLALGAELHAALRALCRQEGVTLFMLLLGLFQVLLAQWSAQDEIVVGTDVANRPHVALEGLIGFFVNQLVLRTSLAGDPTFRELLERVRATCLGAYAHQDVPFEQVVAELQPERRLDRAPLFQVKLILQNTPLTALRAAEPQVEPVAIGPRAVPFDLALSLQETEAGIVGSIDYRVDLFGRATIRWLVRGLEALARAVGQAPELRLSALGELVAQAWAEPEPEQDFIGMRRRRLAEVRRKVILDTNE